MARCQLWGPGFFDKQNIKLFTDNCKLAIIYSYVCRTQCNVTLDTTVKSDRQLNRLIRFCISHE